MSKVNYSRNDIIGDFLPDVLIRRVTLESAPNDMMSATIDLEIEDVLEADMRTAAVRAMDRQPEETLTELERKFDEALKGCVVVATTLAAEESIKSLLIRRGGQTPNFQERLSQIR